MFLIPGIHYSRTGCHLNGRLVDAALVPLVCDLSAARQVASFGSIYFRQFCSFCYLSKDDMDHFNPWKWEPRALARHREGVSAWKNATDRAARKRAFNRYGVRWSVLIDLPYWDPIEFTIIESMHNGYLGLFHNHCRKIWAMSITVSDGDGYTDPAGAPQRPDDEQMDDALSALTEGDFEALLTMDTSALGHLCADHGLRRSKKKKQMIKELRIWVFRKSSHLFYIG